MKTLLGNMILWRTSQ